MVGLTVGERVGAVVGPAVGGRDGEKVGAALGASLGDAEGTKDDGISDDGGLVAVGILVKIGDNVGANVVVVGITDDGALVAVGILVGLFIGVDESNALLRLKIKDIKIKIFIIY